MSKTFTSKPAVTRGRGTQANRGTRPGNANRPAAEGMNVRGTPGYGRGATAGRGTTTRSTTTRPQHMDPTGAGAEPGAPPQPNTGTEQRMTYQGGYTMITPNEKKRQQVTQVAERETRAYQQHKQQNTPKSLNIVGTVGGGQISQAEARQRFVQASPNKTQKLLQKEQRKSTLKQKEEEEIQTKLAGQRQKAVHNARRKEEQDADMAVRWDQQRRATNDAFLRRLENKGHKPGVQKTSTTETQSNPTHASASHECSNDMGAMSIQGRHAPSGSSMSVPGTRSPQAVPLSNYTQAPPESSAEAHLNSDQFRALNGLSAMFPQFAREELLVLLEQVDFSMDAAVDLLQD